MVPLLICFAKIFYSFSMFFFSATWSISCNILLNFVNFYSDNYFLCTFFCPEDEMEDRVRAKERWEEEEEEKWCKLRMPKRGSKIHIILYRFITSIKTCIFLHKPIMCHATSVFLKVNKFGFNCRNKLRIDNVDFFQRFSAYCTCYITFFLLFQGISVMLTSATPTRIGIAVAFKVNYSALVMKNGKYFL